MQKEALPKGNSEQDLLLGVWTVLLRQFLFFIDCNSNLDTLSKMKLT